MRRLRSMKIELRPEELKLIGKFIYALKNEPDLIVLEDVDKIEEAEEVDEELATLFIREAIKHVINDATFAEAFYEACKKAGIDLIDL